MTSYIYEITDEVFNKISSYYDYIYMHYQLKWIKFVS